MKVSLASAVLAAFALCSCGGAKDDLPEDVKSASANDIRQQCLDREDDYVEAFRAMGMEARAEPKKIEKVKKTCCPKLADASKKMSAVERAYLYNSMGAEMDGGLLTPRETEAFRDAEDALRQDMTSVQVSAALKPQSEIFTKCKGEILGG